MRKKNLDHSNKNRRERVSKTGHARIGVALPSHCAPKGFFLKREGRQRQKRTLGRGKKQDSKTGSIVKGGVPRNKSSKRSQ